jgi:hypothetical protein
MAIAMSMSPEVVAHALSVVGLGWMTAQLMAKGVCVKVADSKVHVRIGNYDMEITLTRRE